MAKRSDFAQKLLDDLRIRKERMTASQSSKNSRTLTGDAYSHSKQAYRGSREMKLHQNSHLKSGRTHSSSTGGNKSVSFRESSQDIVPLGRGQSFEQFKDLSTALAFALDVGKFTRTNSSDNSLMLGLLNQIGGRSVQMKMERNKFVMRNTSTNHVLSLSHLHINEIAKGAQKLNQILRASSNGLNFDGYSINIGKELLKGAIDLEESLRMLVNLQETSDYMIGSRNKAQITLLEDDKDDNDNATETLDNKQLARPVFSFDKPSKNSHHVSELNQRLISQNYKPENTNYNRNRKTLGTSNSASQRKSASNNLSMQFSTAFSEEKNQSSSTKTKPEKGRIPNVIAKLMGLEELPESDNMKHVVKKEPTQKEKIERTVVKKSEGSSAQEWKTEEATVFATRRNKQAQPNQIQVARNLHDLQAQRNLASRRTSSNGTIHDRKQPQKDVNLTKLTRSLKQATDKHQNNTDHVRSPKAMWGKERKLDTAKTKEQKGKEKGEAKVSNAKHELHKKASNTENVYGTAITLQGQEKNNLPMPKTDRRNVHEQPLHNLPKSPIDRASQQPQINHNFEAQKKQHLEQEDDQQSRKQQIQVRANIQNENVSLSKLMQDYLHSTRKVSNTSHTTPSIGSSIDLSREMQSMELPNTRRQEDGFHNRNSLNSNMSMEDSMNKTSIQNSSPGNFSSQVIKEGNRNSSTKEMEDKSMQNLKVTKVQKVETPRKIDELATRSRNLHKLARTLKHQSPMLQEVKQIRHNELSQSNEDNQGRLNRSTTSEARIIESNILDLSTATPNEPGELQIQSEQGSSFCTPPVNKECQNLKRPKIVAQDGHGIAKLSTVISHQQSQGVNQKLRSHKNENVPLNRICKGSENATRSLQKICEPVLETPEPLTASENNLMQILVRSQVFLNTAETLFKLNIPLGILHASSEDSHFEGSNLILDCGYEVMKRKGKRKEFSHHPFTNFCITSPKIRDLHDLIKQLHKDLEKLKFYGRNDKIECIVEEYQPKMLEIDLYHMDPDVNCMWDFGWHKMMFMSIEKEDVIRDVEKHVLNGLLDELTRDLLVL